MALFCCLPAGGFKLPPARSIKKGDQQVSQALEAVLDRARRLGETGGRAGFSIVNLTYPLCTFEEQKCSSVMLVDSERWELTCQLHRWKTKRLRELSPLA